MKCYVLILCLAILLSQMELAWTQMSLNPDEANALQDISNINHYGWLPADIQACSPLDITCISMNGELVVSKLYVLLERVTTL